MITSLDNKKIKDIIKLKDKKYRDDENKYIVEGLHLIEEALKSDSLIEVYTTEENLLFKVDTYLVTEEIMHKISDLKSNTKVVGICTKKNNKKLIGNKFLLLDEIQDPGNLGTIIRSSLGFSIDTIVLGENCCDLYNEKVIRSTQGAIFNINIISGNLINIIKELKERNIPVYGTNVQDGINISDINNHDFYAVVIGNEGNGVKKEILNICSSNIYIKINSKLESLNAGVAASIILYELNK